MIIREPDWLIADSALSNWSISAIPFARSAIPTAGLIAVLPVRPCRIPKIVDASLRKAAGEVDQFAAQVRKTVTKTRGVAARTRQAFGQPHRDRITHAEEHNGNG